MNEPHSSRMPSIQEVWVKKIGTEWREKKRQNVSVRSGVDLERVDGGCEHSQNTLYEMLKNLVKCLKF